MKKVTILSLHLGYGGIEKAVISLANNLANKYDVEIVSFYKLYNKPPFKVDERVKITYLIKDNIAKKVEDYKVNFFHFHFIKLFKSLWNDYFSQGKIGEFFKDSFRSLDILINKNKIMGDYIKDLDSKCFISSRVIFNKVLEQYASDKSIKIAWEHNHHNNDKKYINELVESCKNIDFFVPVSNELATYYKQYLGNKVVYIPHCLDDFPKSVSKLDSNNLIAVGRLSPEKGFDDMLLMFSKLISKYPKLKLNIIGDGIERKKLKELVNKLKLGDKVIFHGYRTKEYINELLLDSSLYIMTSHTESFGLVLIEAFSYGVPCLAYDSAQGANEIITNGVNGYLIKSRDEDDMVKHIGMLIEDEKLRKKLGKKAREESKKYNKEPVLEQWSKLINKRK